MTTHVPVLRDEVLAALAPKADELHVDATFGAGGYSRALLEAAPCTVLAIDRDPSAIARGSDLAAHYGRRLRLVPGRFSKMVALARGEGFECADGVTMDIGVSSFQLEEAERGFSFRLDGPLDMRMDRTGESAADVVNGRSEAELARIIRSLGEERRARRVAQAIAEARREAPIERTGRLAAICERALGRPHPARSAKAVHPATRTFQALRIFVNDELGELERALRAAEALLAPAGRLAVVAFHSLEDRIVKTFLAERGGRMPTGSRHLPEQPNGRRAPSFHLARKGAVRPSDAEVARNPRARSARLRVAVRTEAPAWEAAA